MALNNSQFDAIMREYEETRLYNRRLHDERVSEVFDKVIGYRELDESTVTVSMDIAKKRLAGDTPDADIHELLAELKAMKQSLLLGAGYPASYLDPIYDCPDCQDTGYIGGEKCHCLKKRLTEVLYTNSNIREYIDKNNFTTLSYEYYKGEDLERFKKAVNVCWECIDSIGTESKNIMLYGSVGTGKSFLSGCVAKEFMDRGCSVTYRSATGLFEELAKDTFNNDNKEDLYILQDYIYNCDLLIIDDLGTELLSSFINTQFFSLINERSLRRKSTIISTNLSLEQIRDRYSDRVLSRIVSSYAVCKLTGPDIRIIKRTS